MPHCASVLRLWEDQCADAGGVTRFDEAIDEALTEAVQSFMKTTEHFRDQSLGIISHDLRNPLSSIIMGSTMLVGSEALDDRTVSIAARMLSSANRMNRMIGDLLDLTRIRFGDQFPITRARIDLDPVCRQVIAELESIVPAGKLRFTAQGDLVADWDGDRIAQVFSNLVRNAIQHGASTDPIIASQIVVAHGGTLDATSTDDRGTTFTARLPRRAARIARRHAEDHR